jgi:hypothetical protein
MNKTSPEAGQLPATKARADRANEQINGRSFTQLNKRDMDSRTIGTRTRASRRRDKNRIVFR